jgi:flagellar basal-body rod protein FlgC
MANGLFNSIRISASGMRGQRLKMDVVSRNLANAETTRTAEGTPYRRQRAIFEQVLGDKIRERMTTFGNESRLARTHPAHMTETIGSALETGGGVASDVSVAPDASDFRVVYDPGHPDADEGGYVLMPNVNPITEMVDMITASRAYEANVSAVQTAKDMFADALKI